MIRILRAALCACLFGVPQAFAAAPAPTPPTIVFMTDFGTLDDAVAICKGVMLGIAPAARVVDLTHQVPAYSIADGARFLARTSLYYPAGTIFVGVVDPGVGTPRHPLLVRTKRGQFFVVPDNGLLTPIELRDGIDGARQITNPAWMLPGPHSATFHGRDVFSPVAGHLARGEDWRQAGPAVSTLARLELPAVKIDTTGLAGHVIGLDGPYGNLITDIRPEQLAALGYRAGDMVSIQVAGQPFTLPFVRTFGDVPEGKPLLYIDSSNLVSVAINMGNFAQAHGISPPAAFAIARKAE